MSMNRLLRKSFTLLNTEHRSTYCRLLANYSHKTGSKEHIDDLVKDQKIVVFMKGTPDAPMCGFSNGVVQILNFHGVNFEGHDVLSNEDLRSGIEIEIEISLLTKSGPQEGMISSQIGPKSNRLQSNRPQFKSASSQIGPKSNRPQKKNKKKRINK